MVPITAFTLRLPAKLDMFCPSFVHHLESFNNGRVFVWFITLVCWRNDYEQQHGTFITQPQKTNTETEKHGEFTFSGSAIFFLNMPRLLLRSKNLIKSPTNLLVANC